MSASPASGDAMASLRPFEDIARGKNLPIRDGTPHFGHLHCLHAPLAILGTHIAAADCIIA